MTKKPWPLRLLKPTLLAAGFSFVLSLPQSFAQTPMPASIPSTTLDPGPFSSVTSINTDMMDLPANGGGQLVAIVYDGFNQSTMTQESKIYLEVRNSGLGNNAIGTPTYPPGYDIRNADVAILDVPTTGGILGIDFFVIIVGEDALTGNIEAFSYQVTNAGGTTSPFGTPTFSNLGTLNTFTPAHDPHIDAAGDYTLPVMGGNLNGMRHFGICWMEPQCSTGCPDGLYVKPNTVNTMTSAVNLGTATLLHNGPFTNSPDIACNGLQPVWAAGGAEYQCFVSFKSDPPQDLQVRSFQGDKFTNYYSGPLGGTIFAATTQLTYGYPRIEAVGLGTIPGTSTYSVVVDAVDNNTGVNDIRTYNDASGPLAAGSVLSLNPVSRHFRPAIAGVGKNMNYTGIQYVGNQYFSVAYYTDNNSISTNGNGDYYINPEDIAGGTVTTSNYWEVNYINELNQPFGTNTEPCIALTHCSNTGYSTLAVWYDGTSLPTNGSIMYKHDLTSTPYAFKTGTTSVGNLNAESATYTAYPNPSKGTVSIQGVKKAGYTVTDLMGKIVKNGSINATDNTIELSSLASGSYLINITENNKTHSMKIIRE